MNSIIQKIKEHRIISTIIAVLLCAAIIVVIFLLSGTPTGKKADSSSSGDAVTETDYFKDSDYPVHITAKGTEINIKLDGSKTPELTWDTAIEPGGIIFAENDAKEDNGVLNSLVKPKGGGYVTISYVRSAEIAGRKYAVAKIDVDIIATAADDGTISVSVSDVRQGLASAGAVDTETPYILEGNKVILPNGGDWTLTPPEVSDDAYPLYTIYSGYDEEGFQYFSVTRNISTYYNSFEESISSDESSETSSSAQGTEAENNDELILKSESLKTEQKLRCTLDENREWILVTAED